MIKKRLDSTMLAVAVLGSLVLVNIVGLGLFFRLDLTRGREFTLSEATRSTLKGLTDPVTVRAYFTKDLPPPHSSTARYVKDLLEEYYAASGGNMRYELIDPTSEETESDKEKKKDVRSDIFGRAVREETSVEKELRSLGIPPVQVRVNEGDKLEVKRAYMGIAVQLGGKREVIPVVSQTAGLEYDLTTAIRKVARQKASKVALLTGHDGPDPSKGLTRLHGLLGQLYEVTTLDLTAKPEIPDDVSVILAVGPKTPFSEAEQKAIDKYLMSGRSAAFLLGSVAPELSNLAANPVDHGLTSMLASYGVSLKTGLVLDAECANINVSQQRGFMRISQPVRYPFVPVPKALDDKHPLTRGLGEVTFPFMSPLEVTLSSAGGGAEPTGEVLVRSSAQSWVQQPPYNLDPFQPWTREIVEGEPGAKGMMAAVSGPLKSAFSPDTRATGSPRLLVASGYMFVLDDFLSRGNEALLLNVLDWLAGDDALLAVRTRGLNAAPLDDISDGARNAAKYLNILGLPALLVGFGLVRWQLRESRRARAAL